MGRFPSFYVEEPDLIFGHGGEEKDPRIGLKQYGPWFSSAEQAPSPGQVRVGIIGSGETITLARQILDLLKEQVPSDKPNRWQYPDFPGFRMDSRIKSELVNADRWNAALTEAEVKDVLNVPDVNERIAAASKLFAVKLQAIAIEEDQPQVVICALPWVIEEYCGTSKMTRGAKRPRFTPLEKALAQMRAQNQGFLDDWGIEIEEPEEAPRDYDLHDSMKGKAMKVGIPIQILRESTAHAILEYPDSKFPAKENPSSFAWNLSTGLYYKANGRPWRLAKLVPGTCYVGISFYRNKRNPNQNIETSMAQIFTHSGEGFVLRGSDVTVDVETKEAHLSESQSQELMDDIREKYSAKVGGPPSRYVVHKTSTFNPGENAGFRKAIGHTPVDFIAIRGYTPIRFLRVGEYPVLRGTVVQLTAREYMLYTGGYISRLRTYPGHRVPEPLHIVHEGDSDAKLVCNEILGLTKLNWNTTAFSTYWPITLEFADRVGSILSELPEGEPVQDHYRFYM
jgi:hypothetical protein